jgi:hypothetical protein
VTVIVANPLNNNYFKNMTAKQARDFLRKVMGPEQRIIEGVEREHLLTVFRLLEPSEESNNQRSWTTVYEHAGKTYHLTTGDGWDELSEILPDDF